MIARTLGLAWTLLSLVVVGCRQAEEDAAFSQWRQQFLVLEEPNEAMTPTQVGEAIAGQSSDAAAPVVTVIGRIRAGELDPWDPGKASFLLSELPAAGHGEGHDAENCPFCKRRLANAPTILVNFVDPSQQIINIDARKLFDLERDQIVVVTGVAEASEVGGIVLTAHAISIRR